MKLDELAPEALRLPAKERALLAASLWESIADPYEAETSEEETISLALERDAEIESGAVTAISHQELMTRLKR
jgi:putative addiction module component (TIGR02574 family)